MANPKVIRSVAGLVILASGLVTWLSLFPLGPGIDARPHRALGEVMAEEASRLLGEGGRLLLIDRDTRNFDSPATLAHLKSFHRILGRAGRALAYTNVIKVDPLRQLAVPSGDFYELLRRTAEADVVVSFLGPPALSPDQIQRLGVSHARVLAFCPGTVPLRTGLEKLLQQKLVHVAIVDRAVPLARPADSAPLRDWFVRNYVIVTPDRLEELVQEGAVRP